MAKIMVVDDAKDLVDSIAIYLEKEGHEVTKVYSGEEVLRLAPVERPNVIVLDVNLPGLNGFEVARRLKSHVLTAGIPVIFLTVRTSLKDRVQGLSLGALEYITKPFSMDELSKKVEGVLKRVKEARRTLKWRRRGR